MAGCHTNSVNSVENAQKSGQRYMIPDQRVISDISLSHKVSVVGVNTAMTPGNVLKVQVELLNQSRKLQRFTYTFEWFDANGMQINNVTSATIADQIEGRRKQVHLGGRPQPGLHGFPAEIDQSELIILSNQTPT